MAFDSRVSNNERIPSDCSGVPQLGVEVKAALKWVSPVTGLTRRRQAVYVKLYACRVTTHSHPNEGCSTPQLCIGFDALHAAPVASVNADGDAVLTLRAPDPTDRCYGGDARRAAAATFDFVAGDSNGAQLFADAVAAYHAHRLARPCRFVMPATFSEGELLLLPGEDQCGPAFDGCLLATVADLTGAGTPRPAHPSLDALTFDDADALYRNPPPTAQISNEDAGLLDGARLQALFGDSDAPRGRAARQSADSNLDGTLGRSTRPQEVGPIAQRGFRAAQADRGLLALNVWSGHAAASAPFLGRHDLRRCRRIIP
jgi:hypothetical protein